MGRVPYGTTSHAVRGNNPPTPPILHTVYGYYFYEHTSVRARGFPVSCVHPPWRGKGVASFNPYGLSPSFMSDDRRLIIYNLSAYRSCTVPIGDV
jgi:hypothetical protein